MKETLACLRYMIGRQDREQLFKDATGILSTIGNLVPANMTLPRERTDKFSNLQPETRVFFCAFCMYQPEDGAEGILP